MKENKLYSLLSKLSLYTSISVFIVIVMMALFFVLQVKFVLFGNFFSDILYSFHWLELSDNYVAPHFQNSFYILFYVCFIIKNIWILFLIYLFCLCTIIFYSAFNEKNNKKKIALVFEILLTCSFFISNIFILKLVSTILSIHIIFIVLNYFFHADNIIIKILSVIPIFNIFIVPVHLLKKYTNNKIIIILISSIVILLLSMLGFFSMDYNYMIEMKQNGPSDIVSDDSYNVQYYNSNLFITSLCLDSLAFVDTKELKKKTYFENSKYQYISVNSERKEVYVYDLEQHKFKVLDIDNNFNTKKEVLVESASERIAFDNESKTICLVLDRGFVYIFDMDTLKILRKFDIPINNDGLVFNKDDNSYVLTFWLDVDIFISIPVDINRPMVKRKCLRNQGYIEYSSRNNELYIPFHQQGFIGVFDSNTYKLKRYIKSQYSVKDIYYNEEYNVLFAPAYFTGYMDMFLMDGKDSFMGTIFVGYFPRSPLYSSKKLFIPSHCGLRVYDLDLDELVKKYAK